MRWSERMHEEQRGESQTFGTQRDLSSVAELMAALPASIRRSGGEERKRKMEE
jgi:hypothetical protein